MIFKSVLLALVGVATAVPTILSPRAEAPCDPWSDECREVITANACFAAYVPSGDIPTVLRCVDVDDSAVAERKLCNCYGCAETTVQDFATGILGCKASS
ncbi:hypothetical protein B0T20DRAFT_200260 [Sordaria brevicollis]|uniref:Uncharacterized protein n=1 Tax=Sordaria brevicollis TaxID=83679 RepID=A0AAE0UCY6_SORBR|nr:hypothetical protein B0T20DRAFT_200260 [Sordaria brevicollis]